MFWENKISELFKKNRHHKIRVGLKGASHHAPPPKYAVADWPRMHRGLPH